MANAAGRFRFDNFVVGSGNRLAVAAAKAVAESPGSVYNPLFIYGGSGLGKTHLLAAIGAHARAVSPGATVEHLSLDEFIEQLHAAVSAGGMEAFKARYQQVGILLLDDVQFLTGRRETQSEMLRLFNALQGNGRQIVLTSDRPPTEIPDVDERLVSRLAGGLIVDVGAPDYETRVAILRAKSDERGVALSPGVLETVAKADLANVRELQGALTRLVAEQQLIGRTLGPDDARRILGLAASPTPVRSLPPVAAPAPRESGEFQSFLSEIAITVAQHVEPWKARLGEAVAYWRGEGYRTAVLERAMHLPKAPDVEGLLRTYVEACDHLRQLEREISAVDPSLGGHEAFRDPERVAEAEQLLDTALAGRTPPPGPEAGFARSAFEVGQANQLAVKAADAVVGAPGTLYNPLVVYGPTGVGKTHLVNAIGNELVHASGGGMVVACVSAQTFTDELIAALQEGAVDRWRARYRAVDALIIDDLQFIGGRERTQEELFHLFNLLHADGKQIVLASETPPKEMTELEERLRSRFEGGLVVGLQPPDRALRERLFARHLAADEVSVTPELLGYLGERPVTNAREIVGIVHRLRLAHQDRGGLLDVGLAKATLEPERAPAPAAPPTLSAAPTQGVGDSYFLNREKVVWDWPDLTGRLIEELR